MRSLVLVMTAVLAVACSKSPTSTAEPTTEEEKTLYALGLVISRNLSQFNLSPADLEQVKSGIEDGVLGKKQKVDLNTYSQKLQDLAKSRAAAGAAEEKKKAQAFLDKSAAEPGATRTKSGLVYVEITPGTGDQPQPTDTVKVHSHGTLIDGTVFDSSVQRGQPATFPLNGVIACWTEGLQLMKVGGKSKLVCPSDIAYGDRGSPPTIKPGATLVFEVELLEIVK